MASQCPFGYWLVPSSGIAVVMAIWKSIAGSNMPLPVGKPGWGASTYTRITASASAVPQNVGVVSLVMQVDERRLVEADPRVAARKQAVVVDARQAEEDRRRHRVDDDVDRNAAVAETGLSWGWPGR